jgi:hypothetical protein
MGKLVDQIAAIEQRLSELKVRQQRQARRERTLQSQRDRRDDTRRKILVGACVLTRLQRGELTQTQLLAMLDPFLSRPDDRALFGLPPTAPGNGVALRNAAQASPEKRPIEADAVRPPRSST